MICERWRSQLSGQVNSCKSFGQSTEYKYDANGKLNRPVKVTDARGNPTYVYYTVTGEILYITNALDETTWFSYDAEGRQTGEISAGGVVRRLGYDAMGRVIRAVDGNRNVTLYEYDPAGRLVRTINPDGTTVRYEYNLNGWLTAVYNEEDAILAYGYDKNGNIVTITDALGHVTAYAYDALNRVVSKVDALGGVTGYAYDENGNLVEETDAMGGKWLYAYDSMNRVSRITDPNGGETRAWYDKNGNVVSILNPDDGSMIFTYDAVNQLVFYTDPAGYTFQAEYDENGNQIQYTDGRGNSSHIVYDALNRPVEMADESGYLSYVTYDADGRVVSFIDREGAATAYKYDNNDNIVKATDALGHSIEVEYDSMDRVVSVTDQRGGVTGYAYTPTGNVSAITDAMGGVTFYEYDILGRLVSETNPEGETTAYEYDALGQVLSVTNPLGHTNSFTYDALGRIAAETDRNGNVTRYVYDGNGNIIQTVDASGNRSYFEYDPMNRLIKARLYRSYTYLPYGEDGGVYWNNEEQVTLYTYDGRGLLTREINAAGDETVYVYDGNGNLVQKTDADGYVVEYSYDPRNLVEAINYSDGKSVRFAYNGNGELITMSDWNGITDFTLDALGRITRVNDHNGKTVSYTYDEAGNQTSMDYPGSARVTYEYDLLNRQTSVTETYVNYHEGTIETVSHTTRFEYDRASRLVRTEYDNGRARELVYDAAGQVVREIDVDSEDKTRTINTEYAYDPNGNILTKDSRDNVTGHIKERFRYSYDELNRLVTVTNSDESEYTQYTYDSLGNLILEETRRHGEVVGRVEYFYNGLNQQVKKVVNDEEVFVMAYDKRGNLVGVYAEEIDEFGHVEKVLIAWYVYDAMGKMVLGANESGEVSEYVYNGMGDLVGNAVTLADDGRVEKKYVLDYTSEYRNIIMEYESDEVAYRYVYGGSKLSVTVGYVHPEVNEFVNAPNDVKLFYHTDRLGSTKFLTDKANGEIAGYIDYDVWGAPLTKSLPKLNDRPLDLVTEYTGYKYDPVLEIYYAQARMYDPAAKRFLAVDPWEGELTDPQTLAKYTYVINNPLKYIDPTGLSATTPGSNNSKPPEPEAPCASGCTCSSCESSGSDDDAIDELIEVINVYLEEHEIDVSELNEEQVAQLMQEIAEILMTEEKYEDLYNSLAEMFSAEGLGELLTDAVEAFIEFAIETVIDAKINMADGEGFDDVRGAVRETLDAAFEAIVDTGRAVESSFATEDPGLRKEIFGSIVGGAISAYTSQEFSSGAFGDLIGDMKAAFVSGAIGVAYDSFQKNSGIIGDITNALGAVFNAVVDTAKAINDLSNSQTMYMLREEKQGIFNVVVGSVISAYTSTEFSEFVNTLSQISDIISDFYDPLIALDISGFAERKFLLTSILQENTVDYRYKIELAKDSNTPLPALSVYSFGFNPSTFTEPGTLFGYAGDFTGGFSSLYGAIAPNVVRNTPRPPNIGVGTWNKLVTKEVARVSNQVNTVMTASKVFGVASVVVDVGFGIHSNIKAETPLNTIITDAIVDTAFSTAGLAASIWVGSKTAGLAGTVFGPVGTSIAGMGGGLIAGGIYIVSTDVITINDSTIKELVKTAFENTVDYFRGVR